MAYFANGTHGELFHLMCDNCKHGADEAGEPLPCPVNYLQLDWNYSQIDNKDKKLALDLLVPQDCEKDEAKCFFYDPRDVEGQMKMDMELTGKRVSDNPSAPA